MTNWQNRITRYGEEAPEQLLANPRNFRTHPNAQRNAMRGVLDEVGFLAPVIVNETTGHVIDGHLRIEESLSRGQTTVPVAYVALSDTEEAEALATFDRLGALAGQDAALLDDLLRDVSSADPGVQELLAGLAASAGLDYDTEGVITLVPPLPPTAAAARQTLAERFLVPPFSVLDARQGYWQTRKRAWLALGIQSELGRGDSPSTSARAAPGDLPTYRQIANAAPGGSLRDVMTLGSDGKTVRGDGKGRAVNNGLLGFSEQARSHYARTFGQDLMRGEHVVGAERAGGKNLTYATGTPRTDETSRKNLAGGRRGVRPGGSGDTTTRASGVDTGGDAWMSTSRGGRDSTSAEWVNDHEIAGNSGNQSGTSIFDPVLCELAYSWFCPPGGAVLDPFAGGSVRGIVAATLGRAYTGIDLRYEQIEANEAQARTLTPDNPPRWITGDGTDAATLAPGLYDFVFSCPPYADLERYSDDPRDLSTMDYAAFLAVYRAIIAASVAMLREDRFACFVVGDIRDPKGLYRNFVSDTVAAFHDAGARLYNEAILVTAVGSLPIRVGRQFEAGRKLGKTHQNVLVFAKGDGKRATQACGPVDVWVPNDEADTDDPAAAFGEVVA